METCEGCEHLLFSGVFNCYFCMHPNFLGGRNKGTKDIKPDWCPLKEEAVEEKECNTCQHHGTMDVSCIDCRGFNHWEPKEGDVEKSEKGWLQYPTHKPQGGWCVVTDGGSIDIR